MGASVQHKEKEKPAKSGAALDAGIREQHYDETGASQGMPLFLGAGMGVASSSGVIQRQSEHEGEEEQSLQRGSELQTKLTVGAADDPLEQEADAVATQVMRISFCPGGQQGSGRSASPLQRQSVGCAEDQQGDSSIQAKREGSDIPDVSRAVQRAVQSPGEGYSLPSAVRTRIEPALGINLDHVRVHADGGAREAAASLQAKAFTHKNHIWLGAGQSSGDLRLMAHESAHVVQQGSDSAASIRRVPEHMPIGIGLVVAEHDRNRTREARLDEIREILTNWWVGPLNETRLESIWNSFGAQVFEVAAANLDLWNQCIQRGAELNDIAAVDAAKEAFRSDTRQIARNYLNLNEQYILAEMEAAGLAEGICLVPTEEQDDRLAELQEIATEVISAQQAQSELRGIEVGTNFLYIPQTDSTLEMPAYFDPQRQPDMPSRHAQRSWRDVKEHYDNMAQVISGFANRYPAIYSVLQQGSDEAMATLAAGGPQEARSVISEAFGESLRNIRATRPKIGGDLDDRDLKPIHDQLFSGAQSGISGIDWSNDLYKGVAEEMLADHERAEFWISLGLGTLAAAAFVVVELATAGSATFFIAAGVGLGATGLQVGRSWEQYEDLATAADTEVSAEMQLVSQGQADSALVTALVDSAFAFIDVVGPAARLVRGAGAAGRAVAREGGEAVGTVAGRESVEALPEVGGRVTTEVGEGGTAVGVRAGAREAGEAGAGTASTAAARLRPQDAANWSDVQRYIGRAVDPNNVPSGYRSFTRGGKTFLRRISGDDARFARLTVDENGLIQAGRSVSRRVSRPGVLAANIGSRPARHQAHHVVPDQVVRDHPLFDMARRRGRPPYDLDNAGNGAYLAETPADRVAGISDSLPTHSGSHPTYSSLATREADGVMGRLIQRYGSLDNVPPEMLTSAAHDVERRMREQLGQWMSTHGDALR